MSWPPAFGPTPPYDKPDECPPKRQTYSIGGTYGFNMIWRGAFPMLGPVLQAWQRKPRTAEEQVAQLNLDMQADLAAWQKTLQATASPLWSVLNNSLLNLVKVGSTVSTLLVLPVQNQVLYVLAGIVALTLLCVALLMGI